MFVHPQAAAAILPRRRMIPQGPIPGLSRASGPEVTCAPMHYADCRISSRSSATKYEVCDMSIKVVVNPAKITWNLFRPVSFIPGTKEEAQIHSEIAPLVNLVPKKTVNGRYRLPDATMNVGINRTDTLVLRAAKQTDDLLKHEQGHYNLLILVARALARELESIEAGTVAELVTKMQKAQTDHDTRASAIDDAYDTQTQHSRSTTQQLKWDAEIKRALDRDQVTQVCSMPL